MRTLSGQLSRRNFMKVAGTMTGTALLAACAAGQPIPSASTGGAAVADVPEVYLWPSIALLRPEGSDPTKYEAVQQYLTEQTGVKPVGFVAPPGAAAQEKLNLMLGSRDERLDLFTGNWPDYKSIIVPIGDLLEQHGVNILQAHKETNWAGMKDTEGNVWGIPRLGLMGHTWNFTWLRTDWLDELGIAFDKEQMGVDDLETIMTAFKERDPEAVMVTNDLNGLRGALVGGWTDYGYSRWFDASDGKIKPAELQNGFDAWVAKMNEWWNKGWFHQEVFSGMDFEEVLRSGKMGVHAGWYSRITILGQRIMLENVVPGMAFDFPKKLMGPIGLCGTNNASMTSAYMVTQKCPNPEAVIKYINWMYDPEKDNVVTAHMGIPGTDWEWVDPDNKYYVRRKADMEAGDEIYAGEFFAAAGLGPETWYAPDDDLWRRHYEHIRDYATVYENGRMPIDADVAYDMSIINDRVPGMNDLNRLMSEETIKFITGVRPLTEWGDFIDTLYQAGLNDWMDAFTEQYLAVHPV
ncbi:MAG: substrate-binding domain-containing protein [Caldilineaceae bacterium]